MRFTLPAVAATVVLAISGTSLAAQPQRHRRHVRAPSHITLHLSRHSVLESGRLAVTGRVRPASRRRVKLVFKGSGGASRGTTTGPGGSFVVRWSPPRPGAYGVRAYVVHNRNATGSASVARRLTAYREAEASYYGPGLYGNGVACGGTLQPGTLGVASKTLPCGAKVKFRYHGRTITVPVIDRGPYVAGRDFDLTEATRERLGFPGVDTLLASR